MEVNGNSGRIGKFCTDVMFIPRETFDLKCQRLFIMAIETQVILIAFFFFRNVLSAVMGRVALCCISLLF